MRCNLLASDQHVGDPILSASRDSPERQVLDGFVRRLPFPFGNGN